MTQLRNVSVYWGTEDGLAPPDTPPCGFLGEFCPDEPAEQECNLLFVCFSFTIRHDTCVRFSLITLNTVKYSCANGCSFPVYDVSIIVDIICAVVGVVIAVFAVNLYLRSVYHR